MEGGWACALVNWDSSSPGIPCLSLLLCPFTFPREFPQRCFCNGLAKVRDPMKDLSKTFVSLAEWLPGEAVFFFSLELHAELCVDS